MCTGDDVAVLGDYDSAAGALRYILTEEAVGRYLLGDYLNNAVLDLSRNSGDSRCAVVGAGRGSAAVGGLIDNGASAASVAREHCAAEAGCSRYNDASGYEQCDAALSESAALGLLLAAACLCVIRGLHRSARACRIRCACVCGSECIAGECVAVRNALVRVKARLCRTERVLAAAGSLASVVARCMVALRSAADRALRVRGGKVACRLRVCRAGVLGCRAVVCACLGCVVLDYRFSGVRVEFYIIVVRGVAVRCKFVCHGSLSFLLGVFPFDGYILTIQCDGCMKKRVKRAENCGDFKKISLFVPRLRRCGWADAFSGSAARRGLEISHLSVRICLY